jgi:hypothetical protein
MKRALRRQGGGDCKKLLVHWPSQRATVIKLLRNSNLDPKNLIPNPGHCRLLKEYFA